MSAVDGTGAMAQRRAHTPAKAAAAGGGAAADDRATPGAADGGRSVDEGSALVEQANRVFSALADPTRRQVLQLLSEGQPLSASALAGRLPISRQAVVQHLAVLQQSELVSSRRAGREVLFSVRPEALTRTASWMNTLAATWSERLLLLKRMAETAEPAERPPTDRGRGRDEDHDRGQDHQGQNQAQGRNQAQGQHQAQGRNQTR